MKFKEGDKVRVCHEDDYTKMLINSGMKRKSDIGRTGIVVETRFNKNMDVYDRGNEVIALMDDNDTKSIWCEQDLELITK